jgi:hypothetical protein
LREVGPKVFRGVLHINGGPVNDTYFDFIRSGWLHGAVFVNGFNIGR